MAVAFNVFFAILGFLVFLLEKLAFLWGPVVAMYIGLNLWHHYVTERFILGMTWTLFEIEVPRDVEKSPMAMELIFTNSMYHASVKGLWEIWIQGAPHFWFSLEIAGVEMPEPKLKTPRMASRWPRLCAYQGFPPSRSQARR